ncbi:hypothetical protein BH11ACT3_BH11ACT3_18500 [soil metagenome]
MDERQNLERKATLLFVGFFLTMATVCGAIIVSGWFAGVLEDHAERVFWAGAILSGITVAVFGAAAFPGLRDEAREIVRLRWTVRLGLICAVVGPTLCIFGMVADFYRLL